MIELSVEAMYDCPFVNRREYGEGSRAGFDDTCNLMDGDDCLKETCRLIKEKSIVVKWTG